MDSNPTHSLQVDDWVYRDEGHANIVIASRLSRDVLRLRKCEISPAAVQNTPTAVDTSQWQKQLEYQNHVMKPLIGPEYVPSADLIQLPDGFVEDVNKACLSRRPAIRLNKAGDPSWRCGILLPDLALLPLRTPGIAARETVSPRNGCSRDHSPAEPPPPTFCMELKPKWGFLPTSPFATAGGGVKYSHCRFCMFQHLKVSEGKWSRRSLYCPLDLFSGNPARIRHALYSILQTPQNNIRILKNAQQVFKAKSDGLASAESWSNLRQACECLPSVCSDEDKRYISHLPNDFRSACSGQVSSLVHITLQILLDDAKKSHHVLSPESWEGIRELPVCLAGTYNPMQHLASPSTVTNGHSSPSPETTATSTTSPTAARGADLSPCGGTLASIRLVQMLDDIDIEGIIPLVDRLGASEWDRWGLNGPYNTSLWTQISSQLGHGRAAIDDGSAEFAVKKISQFSAACTARDCSVMITFQQCRSDIDQPQDNVVEIPSASGVRHYTYKIAVVDLDIKGCQRVYKYSVEDSAIVKHYTSVLDSSPMSPT